MSADLEGGRVAGREVLLTVRCSSSSANQAIGGEAVQLALSVVAPSDKDLTRNLLRGVDRSGMGAVPAAVVAFRLALADGSSNETRIALP